jgi:hypothetical protein
MKHKVLLILIFYFIAAPTLTLFHEVGHAVLPLINGDKVQVEIGDTKILSVKIKNLTIIYGNPMKPWIGYTRWDKYKGKMAILLGPIFSLLVAISLLFFIFKTKGHKSTKEFPSLNSFLFAIIGYAFCQFLFTTIPITYPKSIGYPIGTTSDGKKFFEK